MQIFKLTHLLLLWMKQGIICLIIMASFLIIPQALAGVDEYSTTIDLGFDSSNMRLNIVLAGGESGISITNLPFSFYPKNTVVYSSEGIITHKITEVEDKYILSIIHEIPSKTTKRVYVEFEREFSVDRIGDIYLFGLEQKIPENVKRFEILVKLPEGAILANLTEMSPVSPEPNLITSDGRRIILSWAKTNVSQAEDFRVIAAFERTDSTQEDNNLFLTSAAVILGLSGIIILLIYFFKNKEPRILAVGLDKDEKKIYEFILLKKQTKQKEIQKELNMSKARLSKLIRKLEEKELIEKKPVGRTNLIKIKNSGFNPKTKN